jgi:DNA-binding transcriptional MerR regulator|tara:strand:- start:5 stop:334 length:330 start_codon:yes stop_codon:yes gene_type:complete
MKTDTLLKKLLAQKKEVAEASKVSAQSIDFWEKRAEELFAKMDEEEAGWSYSTDEFVEDTCSENLKEVNVLMKRMQFENSQLDLLEKKIEKLEETISQTLAEHAKKQKK